jgi:hypothetical protein
MPKRVREVQPVNATIMGDRAHIRSGVEVLFFTRVAAHRERGVTAARPPLEALQEGRERRSFVTAYE